MRKSAKVKEMFLDFAFFFTNIVKSLRNGKNVSTQKTKCQLFENILYIFPT